MKLYPSWQIASNNVVLTSMRRHRGGELRDFRILRNNRFLSKPVDSGLTFFDISVNTYQICMDTQGK